MEQTNSVTYREIMKNGEIVSTLIEHWGITFNIMVNTDQVMIHIEINHYKKNVNY